MWSLCRPAEVSEGAAGAEKASWVPEDPALGLFELDHRRTAP